MILFNSYDVYFFVINNVSIDLQCAQIITIFQCATTFGQQTTSLPPIIVSDPPLPPPSHLPLTSQFTIDDAILMYNLQSYI
jgi:hypothetical protein